MVNNHSLLTIRITLPDLEVDLIPPSKTTPFNAPLVTEERAKSRKRSDTPSLENEEVKKIKLKVALITPTHNKFDGCGFNFYREKLL